MKPISRDSCGRILAITPEERQARRRLDTEARQRRREELQDGDLGGLTRKQRTDLGLAVLSLLCLPGNELDDTDIAAWSGCTDATINKIYQRALAKFKAAWESKFNTKFTH